MIYRQDFFTAVCDVCHRRFQIDYPCDITEDEFMELLRSEGWTIHEMHITCPQCAEEL